MEPLRWFTLWVYMSTAFMFYGVPMGPGWYAEGAFHSPKAELICNLGRREERVDVCIPAGVIPGPLAQIKR